MASDPLLDRLRTMLAGRPVSEQKMFGGTCFMLSGNMLVCASKRGLLVRLGKAQHAAAIARPHARPMEMRGKEMEGYIFVAAPATETDESLRDWLALALAYVDTLPPKDAGPGRPQRRGARK